MKTFWILLGFGALLLSSRGFAATVPDASVIDSISVVETNLDFVATLPGGMDHAILEIRPALTDSWQQTASVNVPADGGVIEFSIPKPPLDRAFFRLVAIPLVISTSSIQLTSPELQFVAAPPLGPDSANTNEAVFHFKGVVGGSDRIIIRRQGALWEHVNWDWPEGAVDINGAKWNPSEKNLMTTTSAVPFLAEKFSLKSPSLEVIEGRDLVSLERTNDALIVYLDDTPVGAAPYEFKIHFPLATADMTPIHSSAAATLKITAMIEGSDVLEITKASATWKNRAWGSPATVKLNDMTWDLQKTNTWPNIGTNRYLPDEVDFTTARIIKRQGRDVASMWADQDALWVQFADNPNGPDAYELDISFGPADGLAGGFFH